jgi:glucose-6-phosphate-specific signal transduction histidine kinase
MLKYLGSAWAPFQDWLNVPIYRKARRIDVVLVIFGIFCVSYYWYTSGWQGALLGGLMYIMMLMIALWFL